MDSDDTRAGAKEEGAWARHWSRGEPELATRFNDFGPAEASELLAGQGMAPRGGLRSQGSVENRVYVFEDRKRARAVLKLHRPARWGAAGLREEQDFLQDLHAAQVPVVRPRVLPGGSALGSWRGLHFVVFEYVEHEDVGPLDGEELRALGALAARIHAVGRQRSAGSRMCIDAEGFGRQNLKLLGEGELVPREFMPEYEALASEVIDRCACMLEGLEVQRIHGDLGLHNILQGPSGPVVADLDDFMLGPVGFDLCRLHVGMRTVWGDPVADADVRQRVFACLVAGYSQIQALDERELRPLVGLRALRMIWNDAWKQARMHDPKFREARKVIHTREFWQARLIEMRAHLIEARGQVFTG